MTGLTLYALSQDYQQLLELAEHAGTPDDAKAFDDTLAGLSGEIAEKCDRCAAVRATMLAEEDALQNEEKRLNARRAAIEHNRERLEDYMLRCLQDLKMEKVRGPRFTVLVSRSQGKVIVDDEALLPPLYWKSEPKLDKAALSEALKAGSDVPGAHLDKSPHLRIR